jgi:hypothetical protein
MWQHQSDDLAECEREGPVFRDDLLPTIQGSGRCLVLENAPPDGGVPTSHPTERVRFFNLPPMNLYRKLVEPPAVVELEALVVELPALTPSSSILIQ